MIKGRTVFLLLITLLVVRVYFSFTKPIPYKQGNRVRITSRVTSEPIRYETSQYLELDNLKINLPLYPEISYGDSVVIEGKIDEDKLKNAKLVKIEEANRVLYKFREKLISFYNLSLPEPHSALIAGVTIGSKASIPNDFWEVLKNTGTAHVCVASGMNVALVAGFLINFFIFLFKRGRALIFALIGIWFYAVLSGFDAPIIRAAVMGSIAFTAQELGRLNAALRSLLFAAFVMLMINPSWITDLGFLLSFFATLSIILFEGKIRKLIKFLPPGLKQDFSTTLSAQIGVAPILFISFGQFNPLSPFINAAVLWTVPLITIIGIIGGIAGLIFEPLGKLVLWLSFPLTSWFIGIVRTFG